MTIFTYKNLEAWKQGLDLVEACYRASASFPSAEQYGLTSQLRRAVTSIPSNVAEGHCRRRIKAYLNHVSIALGSHAEVETCLELALRLGFLSRAKRERLEELSDSVGRLLNGLHRSLKRQIQQERVGVRKRAV